MLSLLRIVTGLLFMEHGTGKLLGFPAGLPFIDQMPAGLLYFTGTMELVGGLLITIGLFTRPVAFVLSGFMAVAYFLVHFPQSFFPAKSEPAVLFCRRLRALGGAERLIPVPLDRNRSMRTASAGRQTGVLSERAAARPRGIAEILRSATCAIEYKRPAGR
jgi:putative oxidoreductase